MGHAPRGVDYKDHGKGTLMYRFSLAMNQARKSMCWALVPTPLQLGSYGSSGACFNRTSRLPALVEDGLGQLTLRQASEEGHAATHLAEKSEKGSPSTQRKRCTGNFAIFWAVHLDVESIGRFEEPKNKVKDEACKSYVQHKLYLHGCESKPQAPTLGRLTMSGSLLCSFSVVNHGPWF